MLTTAKLQTIILTSRMTEARAFYEETLGLALKGGSDGALLFDVGGADLRLSPVPVTSATEHTVAGFAVVNLEAVIKSLHDQGVRFERFAGFPHDEVGVVKTPDNSRVAWFRDPDGNLLSVVQYRVD